MNAKQRRKERRDIQRFFVKYSPLALAHGCKNGEFPKHCDYKYGLHGRRQIHQQSGGRDYKVLAVDEAVYVQQFGRALRSVGNLWVIDKNGNLTLNGDDNVQAE